MPGCAARLCAHGDVSAGGQPTVPLRKPQLRHQPVKLCSQTAACAPERAPRPPAQVAPQWVEQQLGVRLQQRRQRPGGGGGRGRRGLSWGRHWGRGEVVVGSRRQLAGSCACSTSNVRAIGSSSSRSSGGGRSAGGRGRVRHVPTAAPAASNATAFSSSLVQLFLLRLLRLLLRRAHDQPLGLGRKGGVGFLQR
eukprot:358669-Chlamydomonas_euryale.AAC.6